MQISFLDMIDGTTILLFSGIILLALVLAILYYLGVWRTLQRMGRHDFAALIPYYRLWELARGSGFKPAITGFFVIISIASAAAFGYIAYLSGPFYYWPNAMSDIMAGPHVFIGELVPSLYDSLLVSLYAQDALLIASLCVLAIDLLLTLYMLFGIARSFGHGIGYLLGLLILPPIFFMLLGYGRGQTYHGPYLDKYHRTSVRLDWAAMVQARMDTFGSNAPMAIALIGMNLGAFLMTIPGLVLCIVALVKNAGEKRKPLAGAKSTVTTVVSVMGIVISIAVVVALYFLGGLATILTSVDSAGLIL